MEPQQPRPRDQEAKFSGQELAESLTTPPEKAPMPQPGDRREIDGYTYEWAPTGYTIREYFSHSTPGRGPGPGWDTRHQLADPQTTVERFGRTFTEEEADNPQLLPDEPMYKWREVFED